MQAPKSSISANCRVIKFPNPMPEPINTAPSGHDPQKHGNTAQIVSAIGTIFAILLSALNMYLFFSSRSGDKQAQISDEHVNTLIENKLRPAITGITADTEKKLEPLGALTADVSKLNGQVPELATELHNLTNEVHGLANTILQRLAPRGSSMNSSQLEDRFNQMSRFVEVAFDANLAGNPRETAVVTDRIENVLKSKPLPRSTTQAGISAAVHVNGYETFSRALNAGMRGIALSGGTLAGAPGIPLDKNFIVGIEALSKEEARPVYNARVIDLYQDLRWIPWIHVTFEHDRILYAGDDLFLADVTFKDCEFVPANKWPIRTEPLGDQKQQDLAMQVRERLQKANNGPPVNVLVVNGKVFFQ